jgi:hypothetical protein
MAVLQPPCIQQDPLLFWTRSKRFVAPSINVYRKAPRSCLFTSALVRPEDLIAAFLATMIAWTGLPAFIRSLITFFAAVLYRRGKRMAAMDPVR